MAEPPEPTNIPSQEPVHPDLDPTPILTISPNITVRAYQARDAQTYTKHANNRTIASFMRNRFSHPYTLADAHTWINMCLDPSTFIKPGPFDAATSDGSLSPGIPSKYCICIGEEAVGGIGLTFGTDVECRVAEFGYWIGEEFWGRGIMSQVVPAFVRWAWATFGRLLRIEAGVYEGNPGSSRVLEKSGLRKMWRKEKAVYKWRKVLAIDMFEMVREEEGE